METLISFFQSSFQNWGLTILVSALLIRGLLFPLQIFNFKQQSRLKNIQPALDEASVRFKEDPLRLYKELSQIKKRAGVRTGVSLLAALIQMPIFISIYRAFSSMQILLGGSFAWLISLGAPDPFFILPAIVAVTSFFQQRRMAAPSSGAGILPLKFMPLLSFVFMVSLPSGLVGYYAVSGLLQLFGDFVLRSSMSA
jgi:YidC/Oxa1 family membrane protein insertase